MDRTKIQAIFLRNRGELKKLAGELDVYGSSLSNWFKGSSSPRLGAAICQRAEALLEREEQQRLSFNVMHPRLASFAGVHAA